MKPRTVLFILALTGIVVSCIPSLYPLYREKDLLKDEILEGRFSETGGDEGDYWDFRLLETSDEKQLEGGWQYFTSGYTYRLTVAEDGYTEEFAAHLLKLGDHFYLDLFPVNYSIQHAMLEFSLAPSHIFARVALNEDYLVLEFFDPDWFSDLVEKNRIRISHLRLEDRYLLTAKTDELQKFIRKFANDSTTFMDADTLPRLPESGLLISENY